MASEEEEFLKSNTDFRVLDPWLQCFWWWDSCCLCRLECTVAPADCFYIVTCGGGAEGYKGFETLANDGEVVVAVGVERWQRAGEVVVAFGGDGDGEVLVAVGGGSQLMVAVVGDEVLVAVGGCSQLTVAVVGDSQLTVAIVYENLTVKHAF
ncbi:hypothetical protein L1987_09264 [Smallanthus sonchifolius]|uniref:Uncharacterized protein n=1 Tax=Smallanthus sonchifolius TaxID=185202 RepID=A0ACB9JMG5_9ASTR|nr:hypothetical protein L1987_09264 [Smallanthus sonchifolius]